ncbi:GGDEF domain-containing protein [Deinococcus sp.]|uniref:GGDEF domain-containing protein n=1 Tax=Deinococcus sp. TaxID=47478 RepID=UPI003B5A80E5
MTHTTLIKSEPAAIQERRRKHQQIFTASLFFGVPLGLAILWGALMGGLPVWLPLYLPLLALVLIGVWERRRANTSRFEVLLVALLIGNGVAINVLRLRGEGLGLFADHSLLLIVAGIFLFQRPRWVILTAAPYAAFHLLISVWLTAQNPSPERWITLLTLFTTLALFSMLYLYRQWWEALHRTQRIYQTLAYTDELTTLPNRRALQHTWNGYGPPDQVAVMMVDIDHFKRVNDHYGHAEGDRLLWLVGQLIRSQLVSAPPLQDVPAPTVGRWGGEEFLVLLPGTTATLAIMVAEAIRESVEQADAAVPLTISLGLALRRGEEALADTAARADAALYQAKQAGRNQVVLYQDAAHDPLLQTAELLIDEFDPAALIEERDSA